MREEEACAFEICKIIASVLSFTDLITPNVNVLNLGIIFALLNDNADGRRQMGIERVGLDALFLALMHARAIAVGP